MSCIYTAAAKNWCFTHHIVKARKGKSGKKHSKKGFSYIKAQLAIAGAAISFAVIGEEQGEEGETPHVQGYIQLQTARRMTSLKKMFTNKTHWEVARAGAVKNIKYCTKEGGRIHYIREGLQKRQGQRTDLEDIKQMIEAGAPELDIANAYWGQWLRYWRSFQRYRGLVLRKAAEADREVTVSWFSGPTGCGKSKECQSRAESRGVPYYRITGRYLQWFDGYEGEKTLIIEEYTNQHGIDWLLVLLDRYKLRLPIKGAHTWAQWTHVYINTNMKWCEVHSNAPAEHKAALYRRITQGDSGLYTHWTQEENNPTSLQAGVPPLGAIGGIPFSQQGPGFGFL